MYDYKRYYIIYKILFSFEKVKEKYNPETQDFYRYLQMRHFVTGIIKKSSEQSKQLLNVFKRAYNSQKNRGVVSELYKGINNMKTHSTLYIKTKWEMEGRLNLTEEEWAMIWEDQWKCSSLQTWKDFITPHQKSHYGGNSSIVREIAEVQTRIIIIPSGTACSLQITRRKYTGQYKQFLGAICPWNVF